MKKLFIAAMALAAFVSCSKDDGGAVLESSKKAVEITISNYLPDTRAITNPTETEVTANAKVGTLEAFTEKGTEEAPLVAAKAEQLVVLFANNANKVEHAYALSGVTAGKDGTYTFHNINESVTQVAVVRKVDKAEGGTYSYDTTAKDFVGTDLAKYKTAALTEYEDNRSIEWMDLFVASGQLTGGEQCTVTPNDHTQGYTYWLYKAKVEVKPMLARVEITNVQCTDLGETTASAANGQLVSGGYDHLTLGTLTFGTNKTYDFKNYVLKGAYCGTAKVNGAVCAAAAKNYYDAIYNGAANNGKVIAWDISVKTPYPAVEQVTEGEATVSRPVAATALKIAMTAFAHDYNVVNTGKTLSVGFNGADKFEAGKIYQIEIPFKESNLDKSNEAICVNVTVKVANWVVVPLTPVFGNGTNNNGTNN